MGRANKANWIRWFDSQSSEGKRKMAIAAIARLIEIDEVRFFADDLVDKNGAPIPEETGAAEHLYWESCGDSLLDD